MAVLTFSKFLDLFPGSATTQRTTAAGEVMPGGLSIKIVDFVSDSAYAFPGYDLASNAKKFGMTAIIGVLAASARSGGASAIFVLPVWDANLGTLQFVRQSGSTGPFIQAGAGELPAGTTIRVTILGRP